MSKLLILSWDGTIVQNATHPDSYIKDYKDIEIIPGATEAIQKYSTNGWQIVVASNQGGIRKLRITLDECVAGFQYTMQLFPQIQCCMFCPYAWPSTGPRAYYLTTELTPIEGGEYRKPRPGMLKFLKEHYGAQESLSVGNRFEDKQASTAAGIPFLWAHEWRGDRPI